MGLGLLDRDTSPGSPGVQAAFLEHSTVGPIVATRFSRSRSGWTLSIALGASHSHTAGTNVAIDAIAPVTKTSVSRLTGLPRVG